MSPSKFRFSENSTPLDPLDDFVASRDPPLVEPRRALVGGDGEREREVDDEGGEEGGGK